MTVYLVGAGPGDPDLITRRGYELLTRADVLLYDRLVDKRLLLAAREDAVLVYTGKQPGHADRQPDLNEQLINYGRSYDIVVRLKGGDPFVFGRGGEEVQALQEAGIKVEVVPGITSAIGVLTSAGIPATYRGMSRSITIVTGHTGAGQSGKGQPGKGQPGKEHSLKRIVGPSGITEYDDTGISTKDGSEDDIDWNCLARLKGTLVILMGVDNRAEIASRLVAGGLAKSTPVVAVENGTTTHGRTVHTTLDRLASTRLKAPAVIAIGQTAELDLTGSTQLPLSGLSIVNTRSRNQAEPLSFMLRDAGAEVVELPVITFQAPDDGGLDLRRHAAWLNRYDWIVFTSSNAVDAFFACLRDARDLGGIKVASVGTATATALSERNIVADIIPIREQSTAGLLNIMPAAGPISGRMETGRVLYPKAAGAPPTLADGLRKKGWLVDEVVAYKTVPASGDSGITPELIEMAKQADAITFASPSAVYAYLELTKDGKVPSVVACIGNTTANAARDSGMAVDIVAEEQSAEGLVKGLVDFKKKLAPPP
jgi:uroporphyrinogen III methyltransferase/synthase